MRDLKTPLVGNDNFIQDDSENFAKNRFLIGKVDICKTKKYLS